MTQTDVAQTTQQQAAAVGQSAKREGAAVMDTAKEKGSRLVSETRRELRDHGDQQAHRIASSVRDASQQLHAMASGQGGTDGAVADAARRSFSSTQRATDAPRQAQRPTPGCCVSPPPGLPSR